VNILYTSGFLRYKPRSEIGIKLFVKSPLLLSFKNKPKKCPKWFGGRAPNSLPVGRSVQE
jgi:hypothetical protein